VSSIPSEFHKLNVELIRGKAAGQFIVDVGHFLDSIAGKKPTNGVTNTRRHTSDKLKKEVRVTDKDTVKKLNVHVVIPALKVGADSHVGRLSRLNILPRIGHQEGMLCKDVHGVVHCVATVILREQNVADTGMTH
jgi:hypothetical protein